MSSSQTINADAIDEAIGRIAKEIAANHSNTANLVLAGVANGGIPTSILIKLALEKELKRTIPVGIIDISFHRDDIGQKPITKEVEATELFHDPEDATIILVDDVLFTGRSIRAALAELHALGRPSKVELATLVDRGNRLLPIAPDYTGLRIETSLDQKVLVKINANDPSSTQITVS